MSLKLFYSSKIFSLLMCNPLSGLVCNAGRINWGGSDFRPCWSQSSKSEVPLHLEGNTINQWEYHAGSWNLYFPFGFHLVTWKPCKKPELLVNVMLLIFNFLPMSSPNFASHFMISKAHGWGTFLKCGAKLDFHLVLGPLFESAPTLGLYTTLIHRPLQIHEQAGFGWFQLLAGGLTLPGSATSSIVARISQTLQCVELWLHVEP